MAEFIRLLMNKLFYTPMGQIIVSAIFGLALALLFKGVCKDNCTLYFAPYIDEVTGNIFKLEDVCYEYAPYIVDCEKEKDHNILQPYDVNNAPMNQIRKNQVIQSNISNN
jgi:hypothetical protein